MATYELAAKFSPKVDEVFSRESLSERVVNHDYDWEGVDTVKVYSIPVVDAHNYRRSGANRYGIPDELGNSTQTLKIRRDRAFTFTIDKLNKSQSMMVMDAGKALARQARLKTIPEMDAYTFGQIAAGAAHVNKTAPAKNTAYGMFLDAQNALGDANVPDEGRIALISYEFSGLLKQDPAFMRDCDTAQNMLIRGKVGEVDGTTIIRVPSSRLPKGCHMIMTHPIATVAPKILNEYKLHTDPVGISGWLAEGRFSYDAFVLNNKKDAIYYIGAFSASTQTMVLNQGESDWASAVAATGTVSAAVTGSGTNKPTATVADGIVTVTAPANATAGTYTVTLTDGDSKTTTITVTVV